MAAHIGAPTVPAGMPARAPVVVQATALAQATAGVQPAAPVKAADLPGGALTGMRARVPQNGAPVGAVSAAQLEVPAGVQSGLPAGEEKGESAGVRSGMPAGVQKGASAGMPAGASRGGQCRLPAHAQKRVLEGMLTAGVQRMVGAPADVQEASMRSQTAPGDLTSLPQIETLTRARECFRAGTSAGKEVQTPAGMPIWVYRVPAGSATGEGARLRAPAGIQIGSSMSVRASAPAGMEEGASGRPQLRVPDKGAVWRPLTRVSAGEATQVRFPDMISAVRGEVIASSTSAREIESFIYHQRTLKKNAAGQTRFCAATFL